MPVFVLLLKCEMENINVLSPDDSTPWTLDFQQSGGSEVKSGVVVTAEEEMDIDGSKGTANAILK